MNFHNRITTQSPDIRFGRGGRLLRSRDVTPLTDDQLRGVAPSIFAGGKHDSRSDRYTYIPTIEVLTGLREAGFYPMEVRQGGSADVVKRGFTKHMIKLRQAGAERPRVVGDCVQEVVLVNSHDGTSAYQLIMGWFRLICLNGMMAPDSDKGGFGIRVPHKGDIVGEVVRGARAIIGEGAKQGARIEVMQQVTLSSPEQMAFARAAAELRFEDGAPMDASLLNTGRRPQDAGNDLWRTLNRVQENVIRGEIPYSHANPDTGRVTRRHTRPVHGIDGDVKLNRALWVLADEMARLKS